MLAGMVAGGTFYRRLGAGEFISAHEALPNNFMVAFPNGAILYLLEIVEEATAVLVFDFGDCLEVFGNVVKAFFEVIL